MTVIAVVRFCNLLFVLLWLYPFRPNLVENHVALLLSAWVNAGLLEVWSSC